MYAGALTTAEAACTGIRIRVVLPTYLPAVMFSPSTRRRDADIVALAQMRLMA